MYLYVLIYKVNHSLNSKPIINSDNCIEHFKNFKYSILEICNMNTGRGYIIERESYCKNVLMTR